MRVRNYDSFFRRHSSFIPRLTLKELNEVVAQRQCSLISAVGDFHMVVVPSPIQDPSVDQCDDV